MDELKSFEHMMRNPESFMVTFCGNDNEAAAAFAADAEACGWKRVEVRLHPYFGHICIQAATDEDYERVGPWLEKEEREDREREDEDEDEDEECHGHPAGEFDPMGETMFCDGSCRK